MKVHSLPKSSKLKRGKRKLRQINEAASKKVAAILNVEPDDLEESDEGKEQIEEFIQKASDLDFLVSLMKEKLEVSCRREKIQILTLIPNSWSVRKASNIFQVPVCMVRKAREIKEEKGILGMPDKVTGKKIKEVLLNAVQSFYCSDENSRQLPGKKDFVSLGQKRHMQKRLLLCNIKELYSLFKADNPAFCIGFSKFASLRPKWCIPVGPKGTHSVCVCTSHQNLKLLLDAANLGHQYHDLIDMVVCDSTSRGCMIHRCARCPGIENVEDCLRNIFTESTTFEEGKEVEDEDDFTEDTVTFQQWTTVDRAELVSQTLPVPDFIDKLCCQLDQITSHSFIAKSQASYLKRLEETLNKDKVIVLLDFAENFQFVIQDEVQGYHWNQKQCTLHPVVIYYKENNGVIGSTSLCFLSDDLEHDVHFVYNVLKGTAHHIREMISMDIKVVHYFSDGCAGQYKNCKNFLNLCHHKEDFTISCEWNFFATSHGKSPCDGIRGTVKRLAAQVSLQRPMKNQIISVEALFQFCKTEVKGNFYYITKEENNLTRKDLEKRLTAAKTIPGTRGFHQFVPQSKALIGAKTISETPEFDVKFDFNLAVI
ncbi:uncharacterized protein LOC135690326 [Rhopilema esculentum]|uniref:uncharacterized protein LOC135690326 n=1 Tax=Rhopilema esculentum TaxID=499914 RepID=UPI0031DC1906